MVWRAEIKHSSEIWKNKLYFQLITFEMAMTFIPRKAIEMSATIINLFQKKVRQGFRSFIPAAK